MDENKLKELLKLGYTVRKVCRFCKDGTFQGEAMFGTCASKTYTHLKHTGPPRQLSICRYGTCTDFRASPPSVALLGDWGRFMDGDT